MSVAQEGKAFRVRTRGGGGSRWRVSGLVIEELIGEGAYGHVCRGREKGGEQVAVKKIFTPTVLLRRRAMVEVAAMRAMQEHPNIVTLRSVRREGTKHGGGEQGCKPLMEMYLLMELCSCTLLEFLVGEESETLLREEAEGLSLQLIDGVSFMHSCSIYHGDLNSKNILLKRSLAGCMSSLRVCDFGMAGSVRQGGKKTKQLEFKEENQSTCDAMESSSTMYPIVRPSRQYRPPEILLNAREGYEQESDVWAVGCLLVDLSRCVLPAQAAFRKPLVDEISVVVSSRDSEACIVTEGVLRELQHVLHPVGVSVSDDLLGKPTVHVLDSFRSHPKHEREGCRFIPDEMRGSWIFQVAPSLLRPHPERRPSMGGIFDGISGDAVKMARAAVKADDVAVRLLGEIQEGPTESCVRWIFGD
ncbi:hypothetical protein GUITHDRAFT_134377 [Guillardia theta CCMP2712]|uniref:Protein kinase domain-containing protein n=1 Tax=Guillardia theta (strain CCMP2712) TaxID=905079 RepID=L1JSB3_GUITC|nr:hypothetical protein GUITHDRAFT_134377 [Guillardia theta CCMP2712]EKX51446.1 hypothetical protein GUITHDRAFT_134377 [Guillardia theta CCMP2712]|eukprot:XP_005838426.1 hypothetical protein GUITHDRAFT_134377 [Guillardia theta CCMP2712]